jgi:hypothetical protein
MLTAGQPLLLTHQTQYFVYTTSIQCITGISIPTILHVFAQSHSTILPNNTVVFVMAKAASQSAHLEALSTAVPGDIDSKDYQDGLPDKPFLRLFIIAQVLKEVPLLKDKLTFNVLTIEYVRLQQRM